ncbi:hypothetical protein [Lacibacter sp.]|uniref:hypothetical protein n=1 Tax=Lacibacter sp. TaxID=1915409 RepID=UPI002B4AB935|nr:hypothetical protein [Lacibacter sp.]HLP36222.1 hypothetical protein [Lacibacter sp.]
MKYLFLVALCLLSLQPKAQTDSLLLKQNIKAGMDSVSATFQRKDWSAFTNYMHPELVKMLGGEKQFAGFIEQQMKSMEDATIDRSASGNILQLLFYKNQWQCIVESYLEMTVESTIVSSVSSNIGVSFDNGKSWKFIRLSNGNEEKMKQLFKDLSPELQAPINKTAVGVRLEELLKSYKPVYSTDKPKVVNENKKN